MELGTTLTLKRFSSYIPVLEGEEPAVANPFANLTYPSSRWQIMKRIFVGITLLPLRIILTILNAFLAFLIAKLAVCGLQPADYDPLNGRPLSAWRLAVARLLDLTSRMQLFLMGFQWIRVKGTCAPKCDAPIIVCNHVSGLVEGFYMSKYAKLAESSYMENPILGALMLATQGILVDRSDPNSRRTAKEALLLRSNDERWPQTVVFPEGACTNGTALIQFKQGASAPGKPVQPVVFRHAFDYHDPSFTFPLSAPAYLLGLMTQFHNYLEVEYLPVYVPSPEEIERPTLFAANVQQVMANALGVPTTKHSSEDVALCMAAERLHRPMELGMLQWQAVSEKLSGVNVKTAKDVLKEFCTLDEKGEGRLDYPAFARAMRAQAKSRGADGASCELSDARLRSIFELLDTSGDGYVNFSEYFCGVAVLKGYGSADETASLKLVFDCLAQGKSHFTKAELGELLCRGMPTLSVERLNELFREADREGKDMVSRDDFIAFAKAHKVDLNMRTSVMLGGLPIARSGSKCGEDSARRMQLAAASNGPPV